MEFIIIMAACRTAENLSLVFQGLKNAAIFLGDVDKLLERSVTLLWEM